MANCNKKIKNIIKKIDLLGTFISFRIEQEREYKSLIGGVFTILYIIIAIIYIIYMAIPFIKRKDINFTFSNKIVSFGPFVNLTKSNFNFAFGPLLINENENSAIPKTINYTVSLIEWIGEDEIYEQNMEFKLCEVSDFPYQLKDEFINNQLEDLYCPILKSIKNYSLDGLYTDYYYKFIIISMKLSDYAKDNINEVYEFLKLNPIIMSIFFKDIGIDYENKNNPLPSYMNYIYKDIDIEFIRKSLVFLSTVEFKDDQSFFFKNEKKNYDCVLDKVEDSFRINKYNNNEEIELIDDEILTFELRASQKIATLKRRYQKLPEFAASLSGLLSFLFVCNIVIANLIERKVIDQILIHKMLKFKGNNFYNIQYLISKFNFQDYNDYKSPNERLKINQINNIDSQNINEQKNSIEKYKIQNINYQKTSNNSFVNVSKNNNINSKRNKMLNPTFQYFKYKKKINEKDSINLNENDFNSGRKMIKSKSLKGNYSTPINKNSSKNQLIKLTIGEIIVNIFCFYCHSNSKKYKLLKKAEKVIYYYMDIITYISTVQELQLLKKLIFDTNSLIIFDFVCKPIMKVKNNNFVFSNNFYISSVKKVNEKEIDNLYINYININNQKNLPNERKKLMNFFKNDILFIEENNIN